MGIYKFVLVCLPAVLLLQFSACKGTEDGDNNSDTKQPMVDQRTAGAVVDANTVSLSPDQYKTLAIGLGSIQKKNLSAVVQVAGKVAVPPQNMASITFPYGGSVKSTTVQEGKMVKKGELLATLENPEFVQLQQDYLEGSSQLEFLKTEYERQQMLSAQNINTRKSLEKAKAEFVSMQARLKGLKAKLRMININLASLEDGGIQQTVPVFAPISGVASAVNVNKGTYVTPSDVMLRIINTDNMFIELSVFEKDLSKVHKGQALLFSVTDNAMYYNGTIDLVGKEIRADKSITIHGKVLAKDMDALTAGMYVKAIIKTGTKEVDALPAEAIVDYLGKKYIFLQDSTQLSGASPKNHRFTMVEIEVGLSEGGFTEIKVAGGFSEGTDHIVLKGAYALLSTLKNSAEEE